MGYQELFIGAVNREGNPTKPINFSAITMRGSLQPYNFDEEEDEFEDLTGFVATKEQKIEYVRAAARRKAEATGSEVPLLLDPKKILEYIEVWAVKPDTLLDDLDIPKNIKFYVQQFLINEIHHRDLKK